MHELSTARLQLRGWRAQDLAPFAALNADPEVMQFMPSRLSRADSDALAAACHRQLVREGFGLWAVQVRGALPFIGYVGIKAPSFVAPFTPCIEIGWRLCRASWGCGYATEAARACLAFAFGRLALSEVVAFTVPANQRSRAVMRRLGMLEDVPGAFEHPRLPAGHPLRHHLLYRIRREHWAGAPFAG
ncbi:MAG: GNAT family N-acetyltransferase [Proteobacteria bacterium]|nr:GNAT family N-acetyltransferase [Pseudomonadota bacterium]